MAIKQEQIQANRLASTSAMSIALEMARNHIKLGDWITVREYPLNVKQKKRTISGQVIYKNNFYFTIQSRYYRESFSFIHLVLGQIEIV